MLHDTPLRSSHEAYVRNRSERTASAAGASADRPGAAQAAGVQPIELEYLPYGPDGQSDPDCELVATYGEVEAEYAAIRRAVGLFDRPHRGTLLVIGSERRDFLNRMLTNELSDLETGLSRRSFWLNRKGRIDADLVLVELGDRMLIDVDVHQAQHTADTLNAFIFTEDVTIKNITGDMHRIGVYGPQALEVIGEAAGDTDFTLGVDCAANLVIAQHDVVAFRHDHTGETAVDLLVGYDAASAVWEYLLQLDSDAHRVRPVGWYAYNIARIEAGTPLFNIDFGPSNLPHESGVLRDRVNFKKGCYLGQEIVARMESLGKPKQMLVGLRVSGEGLPVAGGQVFATDEKGEMGDQIGVVTSSTLSPMLGATPIAFAMLKTAQADDGTSVLVNAEGTQVKATVQGLRFLPERPDR